MTLKPSDIKNIRPWNSLSGERSHELVAWNIIIILAITLDTFRPLSWEEYKKHREADGKFDHAEEGMFNRVAPLLTTLEDVQAYSPDWRIS